MVPDGCWDERVRARFWGQLMLGGLCHARLNDLVGEIESLAVGFALGGLAAPPPPAPSRKGRGRTGLPSACGWSSSWRSGLLLATMKATRFGSGGVKSQLGGTPPWARMAAAWLGWRAANCSAASIRSRARLGRSPVGSVGGGIATGEGPATIKEASFYECPDRSIAAG